MTTQTTLIIGGTSGVGKKTALDFKQAGYSVYIVGSNQARTDKIVAENNFAGGFGIDLSEKASAQAVKNWLIDQKITLDVLVITTGVMNKTLKLNSTNQDANLVLNLMTYHWLLQSLAPLIHKDILMVGAAPLLVKTLKAKLPNLQTPSAEKYKSMSVVSAALSGKILLAKYWSNQLQTRNVRVNVFHPGAVLDSNLESEAGPLTKLFLDLLIKTQPQNPDVALKISQANKNYTGQHLDAKGEPIKLHRSFELANAEKLVNKLNQIS
ncbi:MAG TPA: SDR family oxidoreductase [Lactobacillaceae bacterium]|jgi:NAD(P)-dependent dehydrogenase (short-subunit alcohol dehydrogenase family)